MAADKYHASYLGSFGRHVPRDQYGIVYLTAEGWLDEADMDGEVNPEMADELAERALEATTAAQRAIADWLNED